MDFLQNTKKHQPMEEKLAFIPVHEYLILFKYPFKVDIIFG